LLQSTARGYWRSLALLEKYFPNDESLVNYIGGRGIKWIKCISAVVGYPSFADIRSSFFLTLYATKAAPSEGLK
jgi:hypothetical protein